MLFVNSSKCVAKGCGEVPHLEWYNSFGWEEPPVEMQHRASMLGIAEERGRILHARANQAKALLLGNSEFKIANLIFTFYVCFRV